MKGGDKMAELQPVKTGLSLGLTFGIISIICALFVYLFPEGMFNLANSIFHGIEFSQTNSLTFVNAIMGVVSTFIIGFVG